MFYTGYDLVSDILEPETVCADEERCTLEQLTHALCCTGPVQYRTLKTEALGGVDLHSWFIGSLAAGGFFYGRKFDDLPTPAEIPLIVAGVEKRRSHPRILRVVSNGA